jgi:glycosyltransferase involved in cell wall biosynthesis
MVGFVHHPLSLETGLSDPARDALATIEARLWPMLRGIVCPSAESARAVSLSGVPAGRIAVAPPGTDAVDPARMLRSAKRDAADRVVRLLAVGTVTARKGHLLLVDALAALDSRLAWQLDCIGSLERDPATVNALRAAIARAGLESRVTLHGEVSRDRLDQAYGQADCFVLPSWHEGYGMVFAEALAWGLPVIATTGGAIPDVVPASAGRLVAPGDRQGLSTALAELLSDPALRHAWSMGAREASLRLPDWQRATETWIEAVMRMAK